MKKIIAVISSLVLVIGMTGCSKEKQRYEAQFLSLFDTMSQIVGYADTKEEFEEFSNFIHSELKVYHELYDIYNDYDGINNIKTINDNAGKKPVKVDKKIIDLLIFSNEQYKVTNGAFNIAMGSVLSIWHDYREEGLSDPYNASLPPLEKLTEASKHINIDDIVIDEENSTVFLNDPLMSIDVGSVGKGYAVEMVCRSAKQKGYDNALVSVGGNVRAIGKKADNGGNWNVGIQNPDTESDKKNLYIMSIDNMSLVTSGDYQRYYTVDGKQYHHIINKDTLMPSDYFKAVTILTKDSALADVLSTAVFNMPYDEGKKLISSLDDTYALWVMKDGSMKYSDGFEKFIKQ